MIKLFKKLLCNHESLEFVRNIYGDEINFISPPNKTIRSIWKCKNCGKIFYKSNLKLD